MGTFILILVILALAYYIINNRPADFRIQHSTIFKATPEKIFPYYNDFHQWETWSPWEKVDPAAQRIHSGSTSGVGAVYEWVGNPKLGQGRIEILESRPSTFLKMGIRFIKPMAANNTIEFTLEPLNDGTTRVTQVMYGVRNFFSKLMSLFFSDKMIIDKYEEGFHNLRPLVEKS